MTIKPIIPVIHPPAPPVAPKQYFGKHRGLVINNIDPMGLGRLQAQVTDVPESHAWAMPCVPFSAPGSPPASGVPAVGTSIWVEFENGDPNFPIWSGCFWNVGQTPLA